MAPAGAPSGGVSPRAQAHGSMHTVLPSGAGCSEETLAFRVALILAVRSQMNYVYSTRVEVVAFAVPSLVFFVVGCLWGRFGWRIHHQQSKAWGHVASGAVNALLLPTSSWLAYACGSPAAGVFAGTTDLVFVLAGMCVVQLHFRNLTSAPDVAIPLVAVGYVVLLLTFGFSRAATCGEPGAVPLAGGEVDRAVACAGLVGFLMTILAACFLNFLRHVVREAAGVLRSVQLATASIAAHISPAARPRRASTASSGYPSPANPRLAGVHRGAGEVDAGDGMSAVGVGPLARLHQAVEETLVEEISDAGDELETASEVLMSAILGNDTIVRHAKSPHHCPLRPPLHDAHIHNATRQSILDGFDIASVTSLRPPRGPSARDILVGSARSHNSDESGDTHFTSVTNRVAPVQLHHSVSLGVLASKAPAGDPDSLSVGAAPACVLDARSRTSSAGSSPPLTQEMLNTVPAQATAERMESFRNNRPPALEDLDAPVDTVQTQPLPVPWSPVGSTAVSTATAARRRTLGNWGRQLRKRVRAEERSSAPTPPPRPLSTAGSMPGVTEASTELIGGERPFQREIKVLWTIMDAEDTGYLNLAELRWLLEIMGVDIAGAAESDFMEAVDLNGLCSRDTFMSVYEQFRLDDRFNSFFGRIHLAAIGSVLNHSTSTSQARVIRIWSDFDYNGDGNLDQNELVPILQVLGMPHEEGDILELFAEFESTDRIEYQNFISIFSCEHHAVTQTSAFQQRIQNAAMAAQQLASRTHNDLFYCTDDQRRADERLQQRTILERFSWVPLMYVLVTPLLAMYSICFERTGAARSSYPLVYMSLISDVVCFLWIWFRMSFPVAKTGMDVMVRFEEIVRHILQRQHVVDVLVVLPLDLVGLALSGTGYSPFWRLNKVLLVFHLPELWALTMRRKSPIPVRIGGALLILLVQAHLMGCLFKVTADYVGDEAVWSVTTLSSFSSLPRISQYMHSFDYALKTMSGWGRGEPIPRHDVHVVQACLIVVTGVATFSFVLASISNALQIRTTHSAYCERMDEVKSFLSYSPTIPEVLEKQCVQYYNHIYATTGSLEDQAHVMDDLPFALDVRLRLVQVRSTLAKVPIFADAMLDDGFVYALSLKLSPSVLCPGERVTEKGARGSNMYFITHGECGIIGPEGDTVFTLEKGNFFGEIALLHNVRRTATIEARTFCNVLVLTKPDFEEVCEHYPQALEKIREAAYARLKQIVSAEAKLARERQRRVSQPRARTHSVCTPDGDADRADVDELDASVHDGSPHASPQSGAPSKQMSMRAAAMAASLCPRRHSAADGGDDGPSRETSGQASSEPVNLAGFVAFGSDAGGDDDEDNKTVTEKQLEEWLATKQEPRDSPPQHYGGRRRSALFVRHAAVSGLRMAAAASSGRRTSHEPQASPSLAAHESSFRSEGSSGSGRRF